MIRNFRHLRELELLVTRPSHTLKVLLSSITSTELRKVIFQVCLRGCNLFAQRAKEWALIDKQLCELVDRPRATGYHHTLEAELRLTQFRGSARKYDFSQFFPEFREKGTVTVIYATHDDQLLLSSIQL